MSELKINVWEMRGQIQLEISEVNEKGYGSGYRLAGPKFDGTSRQLLSHSLTSRDIDEIRLYLDKFTPGNTE